MPLADSGPRRVLVIASVCSLPFLIAEDWFQVMKTVVGILKPGSAPEILAAEQGDYDARFRALFGEDDFDFVTYDVENNVFPENVQAADAWIITGSRHGVYEPHPWIKPLESFVQSIQAARRPLVGICFGHQIVAQALGGKVERAAHGWITGPQFYADAAGQQALINAWHRDQVVAVPPEAEVILTGENCPVAGLRYPGPIITLQAHPEFGQQYLLGLLKERGDSLPQAMRQHAEQRAAQYAPDLSAVLPLMRETLLGR